MTIEAGVALASAWKARSPALLGFGGDSLIELLSAAVVFWRFRDARVEERTEQRAAQIAGILLFALAVFVVIASAAALLGYSDVRTSPIGILLLLLAAIVMPWLATEKRHLTESGRCRIRPVRLHGLDCLGGTGGQRRLAESLDGSPSGSMPDAHHRARRLAYHARQGLPKLLAAPPVSRTNPAGFSAFISSISFISFRLRTLKLSCRSFSDSRPLFSTSSALFSQNTRGGTPLRDLVRCTEAQKCLSVSPLLATLTHSLSRKSFPCHSYANTRDGGVTVAPVSASVSLCLSFQAPSLQPRELLP